jgi:hypothetical protein
MNHEEEEPVNDKFVTKLFSDVPSVHATLVLTLQPI